MKFQTVGRRRDLADNLEWTVMSIIQLCQGLSGFPILAVQPYKIPHLIIWGRESMFISIFLAAELGAMHFHYKIMDFE